MGAQHYKHRDSGHVIAVTEGSDLEAMVEASRAYEAIDAPEGDGTALEVLDPGAGIGARVETPGGWVGPPGSTSAPIAAEAGTVPGAGEQAPTEDAAVLAKAYEVNTVEGVNGYLDDHPEHVALVLEQERQGQNRKGITVDGRHAQAAGDDATTGTGTAGA